MTNYKDLPIYTEMKDRFAHASDREKLTALRFELLGTVIRMQACSQVVEEFDLDASNEQVVKLIDFLTQMGEAGDAAKAILFAITD